MPRRAHDRRVTFKAAAATNAAKRDAERPKPAVPDAARPSIDDDNE